MEDMALPAWAVEIIKQVGPFGVLLLAIFWYVPRNSLIRFVSSQENQAVAMSGIKDALVVMAEKGGRMEEKIDEVLINQRLFVERVEGLKELIVNGRQPA